ncbi:ribosomal-processing cysteine protease Prp [Shouchella patagoniensis]|uniref:ribosomal-processing cysteine protease Prp n=1 Tax=Shouchella patagoniensis TaxID=228576 RepID=UPI000994C914|nr:ribosomal-processing cysteine protease Prp [Shouchella patagoniensis]
MIDVRIQHSLHGDIIGFTMSGHAEAGPHGQDIVCAGASAVSIGTVNAIHALCNVDVVVDTAGEGGYLECAVPDGLSPRKYEDVQLLMKGLELSLLSMEETYRSFITVEIDRR